MTGSVCSIVFNAHSNRNGEMGQMAFICFYRSECDGGRGKIIDFGAGESRGRQMGAARRPLGMIWIGEDKQPSRFPNTRVWPPCPRAPSRVLGEDSRASACGG